MEETFVTQPQPSEPFVAELRSICGHLFRLLQRHDSGERDDAVNHIDELLVGSIQFVTQIVRSGLMTGVAAPAPLSPRDGSAPVFSTWCEAFTHFLYTACLFATPDTRLGGCACKSTVSRAVAYCALLTCAGQSAASHALLCSLLSADPMWHINRESAGWRYEPYLLDKEVDISAVGLRNQGSTCICEGTLVALADGTSVPIEEVQVGADVLSYHAALGPEETEGLVVRQVGAALDQGHRECVELLFSDRRILVCTPDHRIRTADRRWVAAGKLVVGTDEVAVAVGVECPNGTDKAAHGIYRDAKVLPLLCVRLVGRRDVGARHVYDLSVPSPEGDVSRSFVANGVLVHNCYMNSFLQQLFMVPTFRHAVLTARTDMTEAEAQRIEERGGGIALEAAAVTPSPPGSPTSSKSGPALPLCSLARSNSTPAVLFSPASTRARLLAQGSSYHPQSPAAA